MIGFDFEQRRQQPDQKPSGSADGDLMPIYFPRTLFSIWLTPRCCHPSLRSKSSGPIKGFWKPGGEHKRLRERWRERKILSKSHISNLCPNSSFGAAARRRDQEEEAFLFTIMCSAPMQAAATNWETDSVGCGSLGGEQDTWGGGGGQKMGSHPKPGQRSHHLACPFVSRSAG